MKKKKVSKLITLMLAGCMIVSMTACGSSGSTADTDSASAGTPAESEAVSGDDTAEDSADTQEAQKSLADYEKADSFNFYAIAAGISDEEFNALDTAKLIEEYTGYHVAYTQGPSDETDKQTAITNIFMLKQDYQAVIVSKEMFYTLLASDALQPITEYVEASTNLKDQISEVGWGTATKNGEIYAIPQRDAMVLSETAICYRQDWLEEYNEENPDAQIPVPSEENGYSMTISDYKTMLTYFADKVPDGGYAMTVDVNGVFAQNILPAFGVYQEWADVDGTLTYIVDQPGFEDYMNYMQDLYDSGLIYYQATSEDKGVVKALQERSTGAGQVAHWNAYAVETAESTEEDLSGVTDDKIGYIAALIPDDCQGDASAVRAFAKASYSYYTVVPNFATAEQAAAVVDWADKKLDADFFLEMVLGTEGDTYTLEDGEYYPILPAFNDKQGYADKFMTGTREEDYAQQWLCRTRKTAAQDKMFSRANYNIANTGIQNPTVLMPPSDTYDTYYTAANTEVKNLLVLTMFQTGSSTTVEELHGKFAEYEGEAIIEAVNEWYGSWESKDTFNTVQPR